MIYNKYKELDTINTLYAACRGFYRIKTAAIIDEDADPNMDAVVDFDGNYIYDLPDGRRVKSPKRLTSWADVKSLADSGADVYRFKPDYFTPEQQAQINAFDPKLSYSNISPEQAHRIRNGEPVESVLGKRPGTALVPYTPPVVKTSPVIDGKRTKGPKTPLTEDEIAARKAEKAKRKAEARAKGTAGGESAEETLRKASPETKAEAKKLLDSGRYTIDDIIQLVQVLNAREGKSGDRGGYIGSGDVNVNLGGFPFMGMPMVAGAGGGGGGGGFNPMAMKMQLIMMGHSPKKADEIVKNMMGMFSGDEDEEEEATAAPDRKVKQRVGNVFIMTDGSVVDADGNELDPDAVRKALIANPTGSPTDTGRTADPRTTAPDPRTTSPDPRRTSRDMYDGYVPQEEPDDVDYSSRSSTVRPRYTPYEGIKQYIMSKKKYTDDLVAQDQKDFANRLSGTGLAAGAAGAVGLGYLGSRAGDWLGGAIGLDPNSGWRKALKYGLGTVGAVGGGLGGYYGAKHLRGKQRAAEIRRKADENYADAYMTGHILPDGSEVLDNTTPRASEDGYTGVPIHG